MIVSFGIWKRHERTVCLRSFFNFISSIHILLISIISWRHYDKIIEHLFFLDKNTPEK